MNLAIPSHVMMNINGSVAIGNIDGAAAAAVGKPPSPICLPEGIEGPNGYGLLHVANNARRMKTITNLGFKTADEFIVGIAQNWSRICEGDNGRLILIRDYEGYGLRAILEYGQHKNTNCWCVITAIPGRKSGDDKILYPALTTKR